jgi:hypothetical protein
MSKPWETPENREKRRAILRKAEFEVNLAERELKEWKSHKRDSPSITDTSYRTNLTENTCKTPTKTTDSDIGDSSPTTLKTIEKRLKDLEEVRQTENEKHRKEIERLENMIDKLQESRKIEPKFEVLQRAYLEKNNEVERKNREILELNNRLKYLEKKRSGRSLNREHSYSGRPFKPEDIKLAERAGKGQNIEEGHWRGKAMELSTKYFVALTGMREEINNLRKNCELEIKQLKTAYISAIKLNKK